jgi:ribosomal protein L21E
MSEAKNAIDLIENAPDKDAKSFISSLLASKAITRINKRKFEIDEEANRPKVETEKFAAEGDKEDIALDPEFQKEFFLKTFDYKGKVITLKKVGMGASAPVSAYVDGKRKDIFLTLKQARKGIKTIIDLEDKMKSGEEPQPATIESLQNASLDGAFLIHEDDSKSFLSFDEVSETLEIYNRLNNTNKDAFEKKLRSSEEDATDMIQFFQERLNDH